MRRFAMKALFTALNLDRAERTRIDWDRRILTFSTAVTIGLLMGRSRLWNDLLELPVEILRPIAGIAWIPLALYIFGKVTSRW